MPIYVTVCLGLYYTGNLNISFPVPVLGTSLSIWTDAMFHFGKRGETLVLCFPVHSCREVGVKDGICKVDLIFRKDVSSSCGLIGPGEEGTPTEIRRSIKEWGVAQRELWGSPAVGDLAPAHSHSWQSKAAWPGGETAYFFFLVAKLVSSNRIGGFGVFSGFSIDNFSVCPSLMGDDLFSF